MLCIPIRNSSWFVLLFAAGVLHGYALTWILFFLSHRDPYQNATVVLATDSEYKSFSSDLRSSNSSESPIMNVTNCTNHSQTTGSVGNVTKVRILCMVFTVIPRNVGKAISVKETWGKRCDSLFFVTAQHYPGLPTVAIPPDIEDSRDKLWEKTKYGFSSAYSNYFEKADWFLKADDDTYVILDNLRSLLHRYNGSAKPYYLGYQLKTLKHKFTYMSGGAGYVLSKKALEMFIERGLKLKRCNHGVSSAEDWNMGYCLLELGANVIDSRDIFGRERFLPIIPFKQLAFIPGHLTHDFWYWRVSQNRQNEWFECSAESAISFHYVGLQDMYVIEFFLYHLAPYKHICFATYS